MKNHVDGINKGNVMLYALSTCVWCDRTKSVLSELGVAYDYVDVDLLEPYERKQVLIEIEKYNPAKTFPTLIIGSIPIRGFKEDQMKELLA